MALLTAGFTLPRRHFDVELELALEGTVALAGASGAGKSSVLEAIAGLVRPVRGRISLDQTTWFDAAARIDLPAERRRVGFVFQEYALFPHMSVRKNVAFGGQKHADQLLERLRIAHLGAARPDQLSGGERQRVALARALSREPDVLLLDEPLAALDAHTRAAVRNELRSLLAELALPTLIVTHDYSDAAALAPTVGIIAAGRLRQLAAPQELADRPADAFVAAFTGACLLEGRVSGQTDGLTEVTLASGERLLSSDQGAGAVDIAIHPWNVAIATDAMTNTFTRAVTGLTSTGRHTRVELGTLAAELYDAPSLMLGDVIRVQVAPQRVRLMARELV